MDAPAKTKRKQFVIAIGGVVFFVGLLVVGMWMGDPNKGKPTPREIQERKSKEVIKDYSARSSSAVSAEETWIALSEKRLKELQSENRTLHEKLDQLSKRLETEGVRGTAVNGTPVSVPSLPPVALPPPQPMDAVLREGSDRSADQPVASMPLPPPPSFQSGSSTQGKPGGEAGKPANMIQVVSLSDDSGADKGRKSKNVNHYLPTGAFATAVLLSGMDAPTGGQAMSQPVPVLLRLMDDGQLPNYFNSDVQDCHVTGAAHGDIASERAHIRLETLTCVLVTGEVIEEPIKGYVAGEDGKAGLRGRLVSKQGALIARSLLAGIASGMGNSIAQQYQQVSTSALGNVTTIDPNRTVESGLATGAANALEKIADFYIARANEIYPIIEVDANRIGEIILLGGTDFKQNLIGNTREGKQ